MEMTQFDANESPPENHENKVLRVSAGSDLNQPIMESEYNDMAKRLNLQLENEDGLQE
jgi:hypothetical protein